MQNNDTSGKRIRDLIDKRGMKDKNFAQLIQMNPQTLSRILNDKYAVSSKMAAKMAKVLNTSPEYLLCQTNDPGDNFVGSDNWYKRNSQYFDISKVINYLESLNYTISELLIIGKLEFVRDEKTLIFSTWASKRSLLDYGFTLENSTNLDSFIEYETTEDILVKIVEEADTLVQHCWKIEFQNTCKRIDEQKFLDIMYSFSLLTQNFFNAALYDFNKINAELSDLGRAIQKKKQPNPLTTDELDELNSILLRAIYGNNVPDDFKKEE